MRQALKSISPRHLLLLPGVKHYLTVAEASGAEQVIGTALLVAIFSSPLVQSRMSCRDVYLPLQRACPVKGLVCRAEIWLSAEMTPGSLGG